MKPKPIPRSGKASSSFTVADFLELDRMHPSHYRTGGSSESNGGSYSGKEKLTDFEGGNDEANPKNWPLYAKIYATLVPALCTLVVSFSASIYVAGIPQIQEQYQVSQTVAMLGLSLYVVGLGLGPMIAAPISETKGRVAVYWISMICFALFTLGTTLAKSITVILICRFLAGTFGSPALAVGGGTVSDIWVLGESAGTAGNAFLMMAFLGPALGPLAGGVIAENYHWTWLMWTSLILAGVALLSLVFAKETHKKTILAKRAKARGIVIPLERTAREGLEQLFVVVLARPVRMMFTEWIVVFTAIYNAFLFALLFLFFEAIPYVMIHVYDFDLQETGLSFLFLVGGVLLSGLVFFLFDYLCYQPLRRRGAFYKNRVTPEHRLYSSLLGSFLVPIGIFWFSWAANETIHWAVPLAGVLIFGWGMVSIYLSLVAYMFDVYDELVCASALAANSMARYVLGSIFPLFAVQMYRGLGHQWAGSVLGFVAVALLPIPWLLWLYGEKIRSGSNYASEASDSLVLVTSNNNSRPTPILTVVKHTPIVPRKPSPPRTLNKHSSLIISKPYPVAAPSPPPRG